jgi:hypothetical protein
LKTFEPKPLVAKIRSPSIGRREIPRIKEPELPKITEVKEEASIIETPKIHYAPLVSTLEIKKEIPTPQPITFEHDYKPNVKHHDF